MGLPGSGKSTVGRQLARKLSASFLDSDHLIEQRLGCSIREYFEREGEGAFRDVEEAVLADAVDAHAQSTNAQIVLATGGGAVIRENNRRLLHSAGRVVYLRSSPEDLYKRLRHDRNRPLLQGVDPMLRLRDLYAQRDPLYRETAHFQVETGRPSVATLVNMIAMQLDLAGVQPVSAAQTIYTSA
ncbi:shikimate kinase [Variovorax sp. PCZ-1]|nr:shikimate kinase [Variovorax sp. PCZ-1]